ncbi:2774_t:CDS:2 [Entrophospora sp. SA101]|nr:2774_t:CDS:2 [Entrophospora sp. SA101]
MKIVSKERGLWRSGLMRMYKSCKNHGLSDQLERHKFKTLSLEADFIEQSLHLQET